MDFKKSRNLMWISFCVGILFAGFGISFENEKMVLAFVITGTLIFILGLIQAFVFYVCPHCGYSLMNVRGEVPKHCPECGKTLVEE